MKQACFGAGCFWGVEEVFRLLPGVVETAVGYMGAKDHPTYEDVCTDTTGHAEVVWLKFDPEKIVYDELLSVFFKNHNPTTLNFQGPDHGTQYRSAIFYFDDEQKQAAKNAILFLSQKQIYKSPIVTTLEPATTFWRAEEYHQKYLLKRGVSKCGV